MHGYYLYWRNLYDSGLQRNGVDNKIEAQICALTQLGLNCSLLYYHRKETKAGVALSLLPFADDAHQWPDVDVIDGCDYLYVRRPRFISANMVAFLKDVKQLRPAPAIVLELPSYPYDPVMATFSKRPALIKDRVNRKKLRDYVDRVVLYGEYRSAFGIPALSIMNGIDLSTVEARQPSYDKASTCINILCVASFAYWHGIDRLIEGLALYYQNGGRREAHLHLLGEGPEIPLLTKQIEEYGLGDRCTLYGSCTREEMDRVYDQCTIAIECLGCHRKQLFLSSSLKSREYLAKGMPFIYSEEIDFLRKEPLGYCLRVTSGESPIDMNSIFDWHDNLYSHTTEENLIAEMRSYAKRNVEMAATLQPVRSFLESYIRHSSKDSHE